MAVIVFAPLLVFGIVAQENEKMRKLNAQKHKRAKYKGRFADEM